MKLAPFFAILVFLGLVFYIGYVAMPTQITSLKVTPTPFIPTPTPYVFSEEKLMDLVNDWRIKQGLQSFTRNESLCDIASIRVKEAQKDWSHSGFEASRFCDPNTGCALGENLIRYALNEEDALDGWIESPTHLAVLKKDYQYSCVKCEGKYCAQIFGSYF